MGTIAQFRGSGGNTIGSGLRKEAGACDEKAAKAVGSKKKAPRRRQRAAAATKGKKKRR